MKSLRNHISVIIPLFVLLFSFQFSILLDRMVKDYEKLLLDDYSIVIVSSVTVDKQRLKSRVSEIDKIEFMPTDKILKRFEKSMSKGSLKRLSKELPAFYSLKLKSLPDKGKLEAIKKRLLTVPSIKKVEIFAKRYESIYRFLSVSKTITGVFTFFIFLVAFLLILKQMKVWTLEHQERMYIMGLFGAPFWMKSAILYRLVIVDSILCALMTSGLFYLATESEEIVSAMDEIGFKMPEFYFIDDTLLLGGVSLFLSIMSVTFVILRQKRE